MNLFANWRRTERVNAALAHDDMCLVCREPMAKTQTLALHECGRAFHARCMAIEVKCPTCSACCRALWLRHTGSGWRQRTRAQLDIYLLTRTLALKKSIRRLAEQVMLLEGRLSAETRAQVPGFEIIEDRPIALCGCAKTQEHMETAAGVCLLLGLLLAITNPTTFAAGAERSLSTSLMWSRPCHLPIMARVPRLSMLTALCFGVIATLTWTSLIAMAVDGIGDEIHFALFAYIACLDTMVFLMGSVELASCTAGCGWARMI